ncbi:MAG TPA: hypothetical protein VFH35_10160 [Ramlibacter sp.]|nr:hypothetical protein [Ramlibacter sp.]
MSGYHDIGGMPAGEIPKVELPWMHWEKQSEAIRNLLGDSSRKMVSLDEIRLGFESFGLEKYAGYSFYRRRLEAMLDVLIAKGVFTREEFDAELAQARARWDACGTPGEGANGA